MKYEKLGFSIAVDLGDDYIVRANIMRAEQQAAYEFTLEMTRRDIGQYQILNDDSVFSMESDKINNDVTRFIDQKRQEGYFKPYIDRYQEWLACLSLGNTMLETYRTISNMQGN